MTTARDALRTFIGWIGSWSPTLAFRIADAAALFIRRGVTVEEVQAAFPRLSKSIVRRIVRHSHRGDLRNIAFWETLAGFGDSILERVVIQDRALADSHPPLIVGFFHTGPITATVAVMQQLPGPLLTIRERVPIDWKGDVSSVALTGGGDANRARAFHQALEHLRNNGTVFMALDPDEASYLEVPFLDRTIRLARGAFALARMTGVPIVPVALRWKATKVEIISGEPITASADGTDPELELAHAAAKWLQRFLLETPEEISKRIVELMAEAKAPQAAPTQTTAA